MTGGMLFYCLFDLSYFFMCLFGCSALIVLVIFIVVYIVYMLKEVGISRFLNLDKILTELLVFFYINFFMNKEKMLGSRFLEKYLSLTIEETIYVIYDVLAVKEEVKMSLKEKESKVGEKNYYLNKMTTGYKTSVSRKRFYHTSNQVMRKIILFSFMSDITKKIDLMLSGKVITNYKKDNNIICNELISKRAEGHRMLMPAYGQEYGFIVTSKSIHNNSVKDVKCVTGKQTKSGYTDESEIVASPVNIEISKYKIFNISTSLVKPYFEIDKNKFISEGIYLKKEQQNFIISRMELISSQLNSKILLLSQMNGRTYKVLKDEVEIVEEGVLVDMMKLKPLTLEENDTLNYNVIIRSEITDLYNTKFTEGQINRIIENYKRHFD